MVYKFADCRLVSALQISDDKIRECFQFDAKAPPTQQFLDELYNDTGSQCLQSFMTHHVAYIILVVTLSTEEKQEWAAVLKQNSNLEAGVGTKMVELRLATYMRHPNAKRQTCSEQSYCDREVVCQNQNWRFCQKDRKNGPLFSSFCFVHHSYFVYMSKIACIESHDSKLYLNTKSARFVHRAVKC